MEDKVQIVQEDRDIVAPPSYSRFGAMTDIASTRKCKIGMVGVVIIVALLIGGALVGSYLLDHDVQDYNVMLEVNGEVQNEHITIDFENNVEIFFNTTTDEVLIMDYDRGLVVSSSRKRKNCYVVPMLDTVDAASPDDLAQMLEEDENAIFHSEMQRVQLDVIEKSITDTSFLGDTINDHCEGKDIFWAYPTCENNNDRVKRDDVIVIVGEDVIIIIVIRRPPPRSIV